MDTTRTTSFDDPVEIGRKARTLPGLAFLRQLIAEKVRVPIAQTLNFRLVEVEEGRALFEAEAGPFAFNPIGSVHGGWYAAVLDAALGVALQTMLPQGVGYTTLEMKTNFVRAARPDTGVLRAEGSTVHLGRRTATTEARLTDAAGRLYAHATATCLILDGREWS